MSRKEIKKRIKKIDKELVILRRKRKALQVEIEKARIHLLECAHQAMIHENNLTEGQLRRINVSEESKSSKTKEKQDGTV
jgi:hypothetical protein